VISVIAGVKFPKVLDPGAFKDRSFMALSIDFETRSEVDLTVVGAYNYAQHPSTTVLTASYALHDGPVKRWRPWLGEPMPADLRYDLENAKIPVAAWNASFERLILKYVVKKELPPSRFRCTAARARSMALPGKLDLAAKALQMPIQKADGTMMLKWSAPLKNSPPGEIRWADDPDEYRQLCDYCDIDVWTERGIASVVRELTDEEQRDWEINELINDNGIPIDMPLVIAAQEYAEAELDAIKELLSRCTNNEITSPKQFQRIKVWMEKHLPPSLQLVPDDDGKISFDARARESLLVSDELPDTVREVVQLIHDGGRASTAKFAAMQARASEDCRIRGAFIFSGAGQTGRFSSSGAQLHNYIRAKLDKLEDTVDAIMARKPAKKVVAISGYNMLTTLSRILRPSLVADDGKEFVWGDWSAIEARTLPWLSKENSASEILDVFKSGADIYINQASQMFEIADEDVSDFQRQGGKVSVLAFGYGGGVGAFQNMARNYDLHVPDSTADQFKHAWRKNNPWAQRFWNALQQAAYNAVRSPGTVFEAGRVSYFCENNALWCLLPSGRVLCYPDPKIEEMAGRFGPEYVLTAIKGSMQPKHGERAWPRMKLWGGILAENITQATATGCLLRWSLRELVDSGWLATMDGHTHDEVLLEVPDDEIEDAKAALYDIMTTGPDWAAGLPLAAKVESNKVYGK
jgi:DNA polymerase